METLTLHKRIKGIMENLLTAEERRLEKARVDLIEKNRKFYPDEPHDGFTYVGSVYDPPNLPRGPRKRVFLHTSLHPEMDALIKDREQVLSDRYVLSQLLFRLLAPCKDDQDIRDALPECIIDTTDLPRMTRLREPGWTLTSAQDQRQFKMILPRIEFYSAARMLY